MSDLRDLALQTHGDLERRREVCMHQPDVIFKPLTMRGFYMGHPEFAAKLAPAAAQAAEMLASGRLHIPVAATYPLSAIKEAIAHAQRGGKILLDVAGSSI